MARAPQGGMAVGIKRSDIINYISLRSKEMAFMGFEAAIQKIFTACWNWSLAEPGSSHAFCSILDRNVAVSLVFTALWNGKLQ